MTELVTTDPQTRPAQLDTEYVVGGALWWYRGVDRLQALPWAIDDITADFGEDAYERMLLDSQVSACDTLLRASILEDGVDLAPAVTDADADGYDLAVELVGLCEPQLAAIDTALDDVLWDLLGALAGGNRIAEITYWPFDASPNPGRAVLRSITVKPRTQTAFVVDAYQRVIGICGQQADGPPILPGTAIAPDDPRVIDREKFLVMTFRPIDNDPRGTSTLRPAYHPWWLKQQTWQEFLRYLANFATPMLVGTTAPNASDQPDPTHATRRISAQQAMLNELLRLRNASAIALPHGADLELLFSQGEGRAFLNAFTLYNQEIARAITTQTLATNEGEHGTRAQASVHQDALHTIVHQAKRSLCRAIRRDVLRNVVRYNYGDAAIPLTPIPSLGEVEQEDIAALLSAIADLTRAGFLDASQYPALDRRLGMPPRSTGDARIAPTGAPA